MALSNWALFLGCFVADADWHITAYSSDVCYIPNRSPTERRGRKLVTEMIAVQSTSLQSLLLVGQLPRTAACERSFKAVFASHWRLS